MNNRDVIAIFSQVADLMSIRGDNFHRILAYKRAAENIAGLGRDIKQIHAEGGLQEISGIGKTLAEKIDEMLTTGELQFLNKLSAEIPVSLVELLRVEGLGPKRVKQLYEQLGVTSLAELQAAAVAGRLAELSGLGKKSQEKILKSIEALARHGDDRTPLGDALPIAQEILAQLAAVEGVSKTAVGGSLRRRCETIGDIDLLVAAEEAAPVMDLFCSLDQVESVAARGVTKSRVTLLNGIGVDLRVLPAERWGTLFSYFSGSKAHNVRLRERAVKLGLSLNENGFIPVDGGEEILCASEEAVYEVLEMPFIPPVLREDRGEIEAALDGRLPNLVTEADIVADLHMHSTWSDGKETIKEMALAAQAQGLQYIVITDHSVSLGIANGLSEERVLEQVEEIRRVDREMGVDFRVFHGVEMEIRADGSLDYSDELLSKLDFVIASLHVGLRQPREQVTARLLNAIDNPHVDMIGHMTGRLIPERDGADLDLDRLFMAASASGVIMEINAHPRRLDLRDIHVRRAVELGIPLAINTDAHHSDQFALRHYGVATAQRGWATAADVVNCWSVERFISYIASRSR